MPTISTPAAEPVALARALEEFFADHPRAAVLEDGRVLFDMRLARCSVTADRGRCLLHLWSDERNVVRTVTALQPRRDSLRLEARRFGQSKPQMLMLVPDPDCRTPTARDTARRQYQRTLERALAAKFPEWNVESFRSSADLEHSFGPAYARGILARGRTAWAVLGVGPEESGATIEGALTLGILWLAHCRERSGGRVFQGLRLILPRGSSAVSRVRMSWLDPAQAKWELLELDPLSEELTPCCVEDTGNVAMELPHAFDPQTALERCAVGVDQLRTMLHPELLAASEIRARSATEVSFALHGLEYARVRHSLAPASFERRDEIVFGAGPSETILDETTQDMFLDLLDRLHQSRRSEASACDSLWRLQPERWLESILRPDLSILDTALGTGPVYSQTLALASSSRSLLDLLTVTRQGRLAVIELKADDDLHLPMQALDYWARVRALHRAGEIARRGYFPGVVLSSDDPLLVLAAPALHMHPANETVLRYLAPAVQWEYIALDERWRRNCRVVLRKRSAAGF